MPDRLTETDLNRMIPRIDDDPYDWRPNIVRLVEEVRALQAELAEKDGTPEQGADTSGRRRDYDSESNDYDTSTRFRFVVEAFTIDELKHYVNGLDWYCLACDMEERMRSMLKYGEMGDEAHKAVEELRDLLHDQAAARGLSLYE